MKLNIHYEIEFQGTNYYIDSNNDWYSLNPNSRLPKTRTQFFKIYNESCFYDMVKNEKLKTALNSELENLLIDDTK